MKQLLFTILFFNLNLGFSQIPNNSYEINKKIELNYISLEVECFYYRTDGGKILKKIALNRYSDTLSHLFKIYDQKDTVGDHKLSLKQLFLKGAIKIPTSKFDEIALLLKDLDIEKINEIYSKPDNITDGCQHVLTFSDNTYSIKVYAHSPEALPIKRGLLNFYNLYRKIWDLAIRY